ncbi:MAG: ribosomal protein S18-alanine N-acetyltransferase [Alphaproteobacteria bacterium]|nr:ribosomal protein S18-alanine N-acetyltransferase [Alphaproteobacteria bacterium]
MQVQPATDADAAEIAATEAAAAASPWSRSAIEAFLDAPHAVALVARDGNEVVGHLLATAVADEGEVLTVAVRPAARRRGLARALLDAAEEAWRARGVRSAWLEVHERNGPARALYASLGWTEAGRRRAYYADGGDALVLERGLPPEGISRP